MKILCLLLLLGASWALSAADHLTLYFLPSPAGLDWSSPRSLAWSGIKSRLTESNRFMGHVFVEMECGTNRELIGMSSRNFDYFGQLFREGRGMGIFYHSFEGMLEDSKVLDPELKLLKQQGKVNFSRFTINENQCHRLTTYLREYRNFNVGRHYGLAQRPLYGEGAGCSAFGVSFLEVAGLLDQEFIEGWSHYVNLPLDLLGPPVKSETVSLFKLFFEASEWAPENVPHKKLVFWDPDRMHKWVSEKIKRPLPVGYKALKLENAEGVVIDKSHWPLPEHPIWKQHTDPGYSKK